MRELAADGEAETRSAIFPAGACVRLLEGFEDDFLLVLRYADAQIDTSKAATIGDSLSTGCSRSSPRWPPP